MQIPMLMMLKQHWTDKVTGYWPLNAVRASQRCGVSTWYRGFHFMQRWHGAFVKQFYDHEFLRAYCDRWINGQRSSYALESFHCVHSHSWETLLRLGEKLQSQRAHFGHSESASMVWRAFIPLSHYSRNAPRIHNVGHFFQIAKVPSGVCKFRPAFLLDSVTFVAIAKCSQMQLRVGNLFHFPQNSWVH